MKTYRYYHDWRIWNQRVEPQKSAQRTKTSLELVDEILLLQESLRCAMRCLEIAAASHYTDEDDMSCREIVDGWIKQETGVQNALDELSSLDEQLGLK